jgi:hypothetical protein
VFHFKVNCPCAYITFLEEISEGSVYRVIQEDLPPLMELISEDILSKKCHINLGPIFSIYRVTFVIGNALL